MNKDIDMFDIIIDEIELKQRGGVLTPTIKDGYVTVKEKSFLDTFDDEVRDGVDGILKRFKLNERTKKDIKATGEFVEGVGKGLFAGGIVNPLDLVLPDDSVFMQQAREAVQFNPEHTVNTFGYEASKFFGSFLGLGKLLAIGKLGSQTARLGSFGQDALRSLASTFTGYEATDENLADAIIAMGADPEDFPVLQELMTNPDDSEFEGRLKNVLADLPIEALIPTISTVIKSIKKGDPTATNKNTQKLEKEIKELLDKQSVGASLNPQGDLAQSIIEQADIDTSVSKLAPSNIMEDTKLVLEKRAEQMKLPPKRRIMPSGQNKLFDTSEDAYKKLEVEQKETPVPRKTEGQVYPLNNRAKPLEDKSDAIADVLAKRIIPFKGRNIQYFYNTSPIIQKAVELGIPRETAIEQVKKFSKNYAATSPRTKTEENLRSATLVGVKENLGIDIGKIIGPGGDGINEKGYPMIINPGGIHRKLIEDTKAEGISFDTNPKPATFAENASGNLEGVTVDTHAIRAVIDVLNELEPGSVPIEWIGHKTPNKTKKFQAMYKKDPKSLDVSTMVRDGLASQALNKISKQTEYAVFSDIYKKVAEKAGVKPAEAQSLSWFANGEKTGLASEPKTIVELIEDRIDVTSQLTNMNKEEVFKKFMQGKMPLLSLGGITLLETGTSMENE